MKEQIVTFAMGCFWGPQLLFDKTPGVIKTSVGFMGGDEAQDSYSYDEVCSGKTHHAEVVQIVFDPKKISFSSLLKIFWENHNPTSLNRQGLNFGKQYRSAIFYKTEQQKAQALASKKEFQKTLKKKIVTEIKKEGKFYKAEDYHQDYLKKRGKNTC